MKVEKSGQKKLEENEAVKRFFEKSNLDIREQMIMEYFKRIIELLEEIAKT